MGDLGRHQAFFDALAAALHGPTSQPRSIDEFGHEFELALTRELGSMQLHSSPATRGHRLADTDPIIPIPLPDELLHGWRGRVATLNSLTKIELVESLLRAFAVRNGAELSDDPDFVECAAVVLGKERAELIRHHALLPFFTVLRDLKPNKPGTKSAKHLRAYQRKEPFRIDGKNALFCRQCTEEDLKAGNPSYWRRSHHLPGVSCCSKHGTPLVSAGGHSSFDSCPHDFLDGKFKECTLPQGEVARLILLRYSQIAADILDNAPAIEIDSAAASLKLGKRASAAGLRISNSGRRKTPSSHVMDLLPIEWLRETFPRVRWSASKYISTFDGACSPRAARYTTATLCLLAAILYEDADEAITDLLDRNRGDNHREPLGFDFWASREVLELYAACGGVVSRVAQKLGLPPSSVSLGLLTQGLPGLGKSAGLRQALRAYAAGNNADDACRKANISRELVDDFMRAVGARFFLALELMPDEVADVKGVTA